MRISGSARPAASGVEIVIQNVASYRSLAVADLRRWLGSMIEDLAPEAQTFGVRFNGIRAMTSMNRSYRGKDGPTDVLSFPGEPGGHLGDVVVCVPQAALQAGTRRHTVEREIRLLLLHGVLHCLGHDHETDDGGMERLETRLRRRWL
ncbi:MAG: rRNA maturation RNase YbeY [Acidobacteriota bacterium]|nr:rRNA maturation RNase YbeY [Acidobacteriota bacterium]